MALKLDSIATMVHTALKTTASAPTAPMAERSMVAASRASDSIQAPRGRLWLAVAPAGTTDTEFSPRLSMTRCTSSINPLPRIARVRMVATTSTGNMPNNVRNARFAAIAGACDCCSCAKANRTAMARSRGRGRAASVSGVLDAFEADGVVGSVLGSGMVGFSPIKRACGGVSGAF